MTSLDMLETQCSSERLADDIGNDPFLEQRSLQRGFASNASYRIPSFGLAGRRGMLHRA